MKKLIVFDMDGTLADTSPGIINSHRYAHDQMGRPQPDSEVLESVIGGPLLNTYISRFGFPEDQARLAVAHYRAYYAEKGLLEASLYPGMKEAIFQLKESGYYLAVATLKAECFVKRMLEAMQIATCFDAIFGMDNADTRTKSEIIQMCMKQVGVEAKETIMVGDSVHDLLGADQAGVDFVGVTYGFGFQNSEELKNRPSCKNPSELLCTIASLNCN